ncbi:alpha/beta fold hydrolase [Roseomonas sp. AR75]|uniref:alpha/beta fold hydrolase n=1 Tax=Roseomonas sp. AR75 TaxID=2562311 RepID=UPI00148538D8|nr:alpha/beta hydrolase [Roseomonas sp. AR75]
MQDTALPAARYADLPGVRLCYRDSGGEGAPIILLHPNTGTSAVWEKQFPPLTQAGFRVIAFDRRGWGSSLAAPETGAQPGSIAEDLAALADHLGLDHFHLLGVAGGGFAALDFAGWQPGRLLSLTVAASNGQFSEPDLQALYARLTPPEFKALPAVLREVGPTFRALDPEGTARWIAIEASAQQKGAPAQPLRTPNTYEKIGAISCPVLVMAAGADLYAPPALMRVWAAHLPPHAWHVLPEAGHAINWEQAEAFNARLLDFLSSPARAGGHSGRTAAAR